MKVRITDEFNTVWTVEAETVSEVMKVVSEWLNSLDETPIYEILIEI